MARWWGWLAALALAVLLGGCAGGGVINGPGDGGSAGGDFQASALADAAVLGYPYGANLVRWQSAGSRAVAYLVYRDTNPYAPIAVEDASYARYFIDSATPLPQAGQMESVEVEITLDTGTGIVTWSRTATYDPDTTGQYDSDLQLSNDSFHVTTRRVPLQAGASCGYLLRVLFVQYDGGGLSDGEISHPDAYRLLLGNLSSPSPRVTLVPPPALLSPNDNAAALDGRYVCARATGATQYTLQLSPNGATFPVTVAAAIESPTTASASYPLATLAAASAFRATGNVYWRMGARVPGEPLPIALTSSANNGWVFSATRRYTLP